MGSNSSLLKKNWKLILNILTVAALVGLIYAVRHQLSDTFQNLAHVHAWVLLLLPLVELLNYDGQTRLYRDLFKVLGHRFSYRYMFKIALELNFVNNVFPSGGVSGISYFGVRMRGDDVTASKSVVVRMTELILMFLSFEVLLLLGVLMLAIGGHANNVVILVASSLTTLLVVGTLGFVMIIGSQRRIDATFTFVTQVLNWLIHIVRPKQPEAINVARARSGFEQLHNNYKLISARYMDLRKPFLWAFLANLAEVMAVYTVYIAFGHWINPGAVILAYGVANFAGLVSVLPGGVGIYEALMTAVLVASGVPAALSLPVTVMYRVLNMLIQLPPGYYFYHRTIHEKPEAEIPL